MKAYYLAIDIGASSGRHILGWRDGGKLCVEELYRFEHKLTEKHGHLCWDLDRLFCEVVEGLKRCKTTNRVPISVGVDTWGVDFVLLDENGAMLGDAVAYRDGRTKGVDDMLHQVVDEASLYRRTGIQKQIFNSVYQLYALRLRQPELLRKAKNFLMIPDYLNFLLTGRKTNEYTNATTSQLVRADTRDWDADLIERLGLPRRMFGPLSSPGASVGRLADEVRAAVGFDAEIVLPATHDTASAVLAVPAVDDDFIYLSSGTWSLMGIERREPDCAKESRIRNFTNEGGYDGRYRYLKNIMGLWIVQSIRRELGRAYTFPELSALARNGARFTSTVDVNDAAFFAPRSMREALRDYCGKTGQAKPETESEILACAYRSLAKSYADTVNEIEAVTGRAYARLHIVGGGCRDAYLNRLTAALTGKEIYAGPVEATAIGNLMAQMIKAGEFRGLAEAREAVGASFDTQRADK